MNLLFPVPGSCFGTVQRGGLVESCPLVVTWHGVLRTTRNGMSWEVDACEGHAHLLSGCERIVPPAAAGAG